eukprot:1489577-Pleurochrysis_carterae.AAC.1
MAAWKRPSRRPRKRRGRVAVLLRASFGLRPGPQVVGAVRGLWSRRSRSHPRRPARAPPGAGRAVSGCAEGCSGPPPPRPVWAHQTGGRGGGRDGPAPRAPLLGVRLACRLWSSNPRAPPARSAWAHQGA